MCRVGNLTSRDAWMKHRRIWADARQRGYARTCRLARGFEGEFELETFGTLKVTNHPEPSEQGREQGRLTHYA